MAIEKTLFDKVDIANGLELAKHWYDGWRLDELEPEQLIEAIEKALLL